MTEKNDSIFPIADHDWHSQTYVEEWIRRDISRHDTRRPRLQEMLSLASLDSDSDIAVLDVGGGYGVVSEEVLRAFRGPWWPCKITRSRCSVLLDSALPL
jgi:hypothetical protein